MRRTLFTLTVLATMGMMPGTALPPRWGIAGHHIVARLADPRLNAKARAEVARILAGETLVQVATWADEIRSKRPAVGIWHYVDISTLDTSYVAARDCKNDGCVVAALDKQIAVLGDKAQSDSARNEALKWVVHLVGDMHQPLHAGERGDKGGNDVKVTFNGKLTNLHSLWDTGLLVSYWPTEDDAIMELAPFLAHRADSLTIVNGTVAEWAVESHDRSRDIVYPLLPQNLVIDSAYVAGARPVIVDQLQRAAIRLAAVLNRTLGK